MRGSQFIGQGMSEKGGWSRAQLDLIQVAWPPREGWRQEAETRDFPDEVAKAFMELKDAHLSD